MSGEREALDRRVELEDVVRGLVEMVDRYLDTHSDWRRSAYELIEGEEANALWRKAREVIGEDVS